MSPVNWSVENKQASFWSVLVHQLCVHKIGQDALVGFFFYLKNDYHILKHLVFQRFLKKTILVWQRGYILFNSALNSYNIRAWNFVPQYFSRVIKSENNLANNHCWDNLCSSDHYKVHMYVRNTNLHWTFSFGKASWQNPPFFETMSSSLKSWKCYM